MTQNLGICCLPDAPLERNPKVPGAFNWYNSNQMEVFISQFAVKIQRGWMCNCCHHALLQMKCMLESQASWRRLIDSLKKKITEKDWQSLLVEGGDPKVQWSASPFDQEHVLEQAQAICHAIKILYNHKLCFRKNNTAHSAKEKAQKLEANVLHVTSTNDKQSLNLEHVQKFVWKAHDYKMVY